MKAKQRETLSAREMKSIALILKAKHISIWIYCFINIIFWPNRKKKKREKKMRQKRKEKITNNINKEVRQWKKVRFVYLSDKHRQISVFHCFFSIRIRYRNLYTRRRKSKVSRRYMKRIALLSDHTTEYMKQERRKIGQKWLENEIERKRLKFLNHYWVELGTAAAGVIVVVAVVGPFSVGINNRPIFFDEWSVNVDLFNASFNAIRHSWNETTS